MSDIQSILVIDDDPGVRATVSRCLRSGGFQIEEAETASDARKLFKQNQFALAVVDLSLPDGDGLGLTREFKDTSDIGIIILTGNADSTETVVSLEIGADDYISKPFEPRVLLARVRSVLRRIGSNLNTVKTDVRLYCFDRWTLDINTQELSSDGGETHSLTSAEFDLLKTLAEHPGKVLSRDQLFDLIFGNDAPAFDRSIDSRVSRLRNKIEEIPDNPKLIVTVRNRGYRFTPSVLRE